MELTQKNNSEHIPGFRIHRFRDFDSLRLLSIDSRIPLETQLLCPGCRSVLAPLVVLRGTGDRTAARIGCCSTCGYVGYMDRPSREWMLRFYDDDWDTLHARSEAFQSTWSHLSAPQKAAAGLIETIVVDKQRPVGDIGCGYGFILREFSERGFKNIFGVENSRFRAERTHALYGFPVFQGNFEGDEVKKELKNIAPVAVFFSFHVLEHVYDPDEIIATASGMQGRGDYFILALPDGEVESVANHIFWLPHLHEFTRVGLEMMLNRNGYEVVDDSLNMHGHLIVVCQKTDHPKRRYAPVGQYREKALDRIQAFFRLPTLARGQQYYFRWGKKGRDESVAPAHTFFALEQVSRLSENVLRKIKGRLFGTYTDRRSIVMSVPSDGIRGDGSGIFCIQYDGPVQLLIK